MVINADVRKQQAEAFHQKMRDHYQLARNGQAQHYQEAVKRYPHLLALVGIMRWPLQGPPKLR